MNRRQFFPPNPVVPTRVSNKRWIVVFSSDVVEELNRIYAERLNFENKDDSDASDDDSDASDDDGEPSTSGKWMLFFDDIHENIARGMTHHDYAWQFIKRLVKERGSEVGMHEAKCSTGFEGDTKVPGKHNGVICCYSRNYFDKAAVKRVADAIREVVDYPRDMFFKTDNDTIAGKYRCYGNKFVSIYKHTVNGEMFERDKKVQYLWNRVYV